MVEEKEGKVVNKRMVCSSFKQCTTWWRKKKEKEVNKRYGLLILGGTGESTRRPGPSDEQHTLGVVGLVHPLYSTQYVYQLLHTHRHNNQYVQYVLQYQAKGRAHCGCGAPMVRNAHTHITII